MGNRASVSFVKYEVEIGDKEKRLRREESVALFNHWGGMEFVEEAKKYINGLIKKYGNKSGMPIERREPRTVMVDFIRYLTKEMKEVECDLYLGKDGDDGDNSDQGHFAINVDTGFVDKVAR